MGQQAAAWIFFEQRRIGGLGGVGAQARQYRVDVVAVGQFGELGADGQVDGVVGALVLEQLGARRDQPHRRCGGPPGRARTGSGPGTPAGCSRRRCRWPRRAGRNPRSRSSPATSAAWPPWPLALRTRILVSASLAGVTSVMSARVTCSPSAGAGAFGSAAGGGALHAAASWTSAGLTQRHHPHQQRHHGEGDEQQDCRAGSYGDGRGDPVCRTPCRL